LSANNIDHDQGHPQTKCIYEKHYSNLASGGHVFLDIIMHFRNLHKSHLKTIYDKYHSNLDSGSIEEDF